MAFTGRAVYDDWDSIAEDVSPLVSMLAVTYTPVLDILGTSDNAATNVKHEWLEDKLWPYKTTLAANVASIVTGSGTAGGAHGIQTALFTTVFRAGDLARISAANGVYNEVVFVSSVDATTLYVERAQGGTTATSFTSGDAIEVIAGGALEGETFLADQSLARTRLSNWTQIFNKGVEVSGTAAAVSPIGGQDEFSRQKLSRTIELLRQLERAVLVGRTISNTLGSSTARRFMAGLCGSIFTNVASNATFTESLMNNAIQLAYNEGSRQIDLLVVNPSIKREMSGWNSSRINIAQGGTQEDWYKTLVSMYQGDFGVQRVVMSPDLTKVGVSVLALDSTRIKIVPLAGRSFQYEDIAKVGDSKRGSIVGEYTVELKNEKAHAIVLGKVS